MPGPRKRHTDAETANFLKCRRATPWVSDDSVRRIWNIAAELRPDGVNLSHGVANREVQHALHPYLNVFDVHRLEGGRGTVEVLIAHPQKILSLAAQESDMWAAALGSIGPQLSSVLYHDEIVTGNILAPSKNKKMLTVYIGFLEMRESLHLEQAWLPVMLMQRNVLNAVAGGLSAICRQLVKKLHATEHQQQMTLQLRDGQKHFRVSPFSRLLSDHDAQRGTYNSKGSAGIVPCLYCSNCLAADHCDHVAGAIGIHEWDAGKFSLREDRAFFSALDEMRDIRRKADLTFREKAMGVSRDLRGLLFDVAARAMLPPSKASVDTLHCYYTQGCASWEVAHLLRHLIDIGVSLSELRDAAVAAEWRLPGQGHIPACGTLRAILHENMLKDEGEGHYRGQGQQCRKLVFLLSYYCCALLSGRAESAAIAESFSLLVRCCRELRRLAYSWAPLAAGDCNRLRAAQADHMRAYVRAWGRALCRPKHHHRMHIPNCAEDMGLLPDCSLHEKKHRLLKSGGLVDNQARKLVDASLALQQAILPRMLEITLQDEGCVFAQWSLCGAAQPASSAMRSKLRDNSLQCSTSMRLHMAEIHACDVVCWQNAAGIVQQCLQGQTAGLVILLQELTLVSQHSYGSKWRSTGNVIMKTIHVNDPIDIPAWWRYEIDSSVVVCLH